MNTSVKSRRPSFKPGRFDPCFCNSGKRFKSCCGSKDPRRQPPYGVQVIHNFLSNQQCDDWVTRAELKKHTWLEVVDSENSSHDKVVRKMDPARVTQKVELEEMQQELNAVVTRGLHENVEPYYKHKIAWYEEPTLLRYTPGGMYKAHADSDSYDVDLDIWYKTLDRSVSLLVYLNDDYSGGAIKFNTFNFRYQPKKGDLLFFPSDFRYIHEAEKVESGVRYALVSWSALSNTPRVMSGRPEDSIVLDESGV